MNHKAYDDIIHRFNKSLYGVDTRNMKDAEMDVAIEKAERRRELLEARERLTNPQAFEQTPLYELSESEQLKRRKHDLLDAKLSKVAGGRKLKKKSNETLQKELEIIRHMVDVEND